MSIKVMSEVWEHAPFVGTDLLILLALADMANDDRECWPGLKHVAHKGRITIQQATSVIKNLEVQGVIEVVHRTVPGRGNISNLYRIRGVAQWDLLVEYDSDNPPQAQHTPLPKHSIPPSHNATGEIGNESVLEPSLETKTPLPKAKGRKADPQFDAISRIWNITAGGWVSNMQGMMFGSKKVKGEWLRCEFEPHATLDEIVCFEPYLRQRMADKNITDVPTAAVTIQRWFYDFRSEVERKRNQPAPTVFDPSNWFVPEVGGD